MRTRGDCWAGHVVLRETRRVLIAGNSLFVILPEPLGEAAEDGKLRPRERVRGTAGALTGRLVLAR